MNYTFLSGATSDIGKAIAHSLSRSRTLLLSARDKKKLEEIELIPDFPHKILPLDLNHIQDIKPSIESFILGGGGGDRHFYSLRWGR